MRIDLADRQWRDVEQGRLLGPDAHRYTRRTTRTKRKEVDRLVEQGVPLVLFYWAGDQLDWFDGTDAQDQWQAVRAHVTSDEPRRKGDIEWTAGCWEDENGRRLVLLTGHC